MQTFRELFPYNEVKIIQKYKVPPKATINLPDVDETQLIGIEVEVEKLINIQPNLLYWDMIEDGSLRKNGYEFRSLALPAKVLVIALQELYQSLIENQPEHDFSERTSIHVHLDFRDYTPLDLLKM